MIMFGIVKIVVKSIEDSTMLKQCSNTIIRSKNVWLIKPKLKPKKEDRQVIVKSYDGNFVYIYV